MMDAAYKEFDKLVDMSLLPDTAFARLVHQYALAGAKEHLSLLVDETQQFPPVEQLSIYARISPFHWRAASRIAAQLSSYSADEQAEIHWNAVMANVAATGEFFWRSSSLRTLRDLQQHSDRARQLANFNYCFWNPTIEAFSDCLLRRDLSDIERLIITYGEACCYAIRKDEERFEHSATQFAELWSEYDQVRSQDSILPSLVKPAYMLIEGLRQFSKAKSATYTKLIEHIQQIRSNHYSPYTRLHTDILSAEDTLSFDYWGGSIQQKIDWTLQGLNTLSYAVTSGVSTEWYGYLQYVIAQRSSYSGIYDIARDMIHDLEHQHSPYALGARGYYLAELEQFEESSDVYEQFLRQVEHEQALAHRGEIDYPPAIRQSDMAFSYYYAAQSLFHVRYMHNDNVTRCAEMVEKYFVWSEYLSLSARSILNEICRAMQSELNEDLADAVTHYEQYLQVVSGDDYISKIKTLSRMAQIYAEDLKNFDKADEHLQSLKRLLPTIQKHSTIPFENLDQYLNDRQRTQATTVQLWLTNYALKATQKVLSALDTVTNQLASAYQLVEEQNNQLTSYNQRLMDLNQEKNEFLGIAAHDLKSPLSGIVLAVDMLEKYIHRMTFDQRIKKLQDVRHTAQRMSAIITNLLDINAIETGKFNFSMTTFNFADAVFKTVDDYRERASVKNIALHYSADDELAEAFADPNATMEILDNLISNAVKYSPHNTSVYVSVRTQVDEHGVGRVRCEVRDEGPGLSEEDKTKLFGKFVRLSAKPTGGEHSTGLGLSIVKKLAETMSGRVWCESRKDEGIPGATFIVELPQTPPQTPSAHQAEMQLTAAQSMQST
jgi:signal transduction histidine kinase